MSYSTVVYDAKKGGIRSLTIPEEFLMEHCLEDVEPGGRFFEKVREHLASIGRCECDECVQYEVELIMDVVPNLKEAWELYEAGVPTDGFPNMLNVAELLGELQETMKVLRTFEAKEGLQVPLEYLSHAVSQAQQVAEIALFVGRQREHLATTLRRMVDAWKNPSMLLLLTSEEQALLDRAEQVLRFYSTGQG